MVEPLNILLIEDSEGDAFLIIQELKKGNFNPVWQRVHKADSFQTQLLTRDWDIIISDYYLPGFDAPKALAILKESQLDIPFIVVSGVIGEQVAVEMMKSGALDYLMKNNLTRLSEAVRRELREAQVRKERNKATTLLKRQQAAMEAAIDGIGILHGDSYLYVNQAKLNLFGYEYPEELVGKTWRYLYSPEEVKRLEREVYPLLERERSWHGEMIATRKDGSTFIQGGTLTLTEDGLLISVSRDISHQKHLETRLRSSEKQMRNVFEAMQDLVLICSVQEGKITGIELAPTISNQPADSVDDVVCQTIEFLWENTAGIIIQQVLTSGETKQFEYSLELNGHKQWFSAHISSMSEQKVLWVARDISDLKLAEQLLFQEKELAQVTLQSIGDAVITTDSAGKICKLNPVAEQLTGWNTAETQGQPVSEVFNIVHEETRKPAENPIKKALREKRVVGLANHTVLIARDGSEYAIEDSAAPILDREGHIIGAVMVFHDVSHSRNLNRQLSWQASHDSLTQLANRRNFDQILIDALQTAHLDHHQHVLCFLDLDQFKVINDTCGHAAGDEVLCQVAKLLQQSIRATDTLARLGGDEFAILLNQCPLEKATDIAENLRHTIGNFRFQWQEKNFSIGTSIGLVKIDKNSSDIGAIVGAADAACYTAKGKGRNRIQVYQDDDATLMQQQGEQQWSLRIKQALEEDLFCLYAQAIVPTSEYSTQASFCEILLRMVTANGEVVTAGAFIQAAERYNLILDIDRWVINKFLRDYYPLLQKSANETVQPLLYMINLSGANVGDEQFLAFLKQQLELHPGAAQWMCFEITETAVIANLNQAVCFIQELKQVGCRFALDDFGAGMSSFAYLKTLPVDFLKIDGRFMKDLVDDPATFAIVKSINHIGHVMGLQTIAEFVSNAAIRQKLKEIKVNYVQGFEIEMPKAWRP